MGLTQDSNPPDHTHHPFNFYHHPHSAYPIPRIPGPCRDRLTLQDFPNTPCVFLPLCFSSPGSFGLECPPHPALPPSSHFYPFSSPGPVEILILQSRDTSSDSEKLKNFLCSQKALLHSCFTSLEQAKSWGLLRRTL